MHVNYVDAILFVLLAVFIIYGLSQGFMKQVVGLLSTICALIVAYFFCNKLADTLFYNTPLGDYFCDVIKGILGEEWNVEINVAEIGEILASKNLPSFITDAIVSLVESLTIESVNLAEVVSATIAKYVLVALSYTAITLVAKLVFFLIEKFLAYVIKRSPIKIVDTILGGFVGAIKVSIGIWIVIFIIQILPAESLKGLQDKISESVLGTLYSKYNPFAYLISLIFK